MLCFFIGISISTSLSCVEKSYLELTSSIFEILRLASLRIPFGLYLSFDQNGKITEGGDFGDATGLVMAVMPDAAE